MVRGTVRVPEGLEPMFQKAEELVSRYFADTRHDPSRGTIEIVGERYVLVRAASLSVEFFQVVDDLYGEHLRSEGEAFARHILFDLAHALGKSDAKNFHQKMNLDDPIAKLSAGPVHFAYSGWASVDIFPESTPTPDDNFYLVYDHPYSFESDAWLRAGKPREFPVCIMNAGYSSGWCEESFGVKLVASEILCRARSDDACRFVMAHPDRIEAHLTRYRASNPRIADRIRGYGTRGGFAAGIEREKKLRQISKLEAIASLAGGVAHDFNNLIAIMLTRTARLASRLPDDPSLRGELAEVQRAAERAAQLTSKLLAFGQAEVMQRKVIDVDAAINELAPMLGPLVGEDTQLERRTSRSTALIHGDRGQLEQIVLNLVLNARDAMPRGGRLLVETDTRYATTPLDLTTGTLASGRYVQIVVEDTGTGMDDDTLSKIFDPFFTTKPAGLGTGLGLSTVYGIVRQASGGIMVTSTPGQGSRFVVYLPAVAREAVEYITPVPSANQATGGTETILVVEDQPALAEAIRDTLSDYGYRVVVAEPQQAIALVEKGDHVDLLVTDVVMPRISGSELAAQIRAVRDSIKVMFISGYTRDAIVREGVGDRTATFLPKPFSPEQLARGVRRAIDGR